MACRGSQNMPVAEPRSVPGSSSLALDSMALTSGLNCASG